MTRVNENEELTLRLTKCSRVQYYHHSSRILRIFQSQRRKGYCLGDQHGLREYFRQNCFQDGMLHLVENLLHGNLFGTQVIRTLCFSKGEIVIQSCHSGLKSPEGLPGYTWGKELGRCSDRHSREREKRIRTGVRRYLSILVGTQR